MKLKIFNFETELHLNDGKVNVVEVHSKSLFRKVIESIKHQSRNESPVEKIWIYSDDYQEVNSRDIDLVFDFFNMFSNIRIINPVAKIIEENLDEYKNKVIENTNAQLNKLAAELLYDLDIGIDYKKSYHLVELLTILKIKIEEEQSILDNLFVLIDYLSMFKPKTFLFIVNLKTYLSFEEINEVYTYILAKDVNIVLLEGRASKRIISNEHKLVINEDFDDYYKEY